ncbi:hypothetical protein GCM10022420_081640 [Streptomyces iranensis]
MRKDWIDPRYRAVVMTLRGLRECTGRPVKGFLIPERGSGQAQDKRS